MPADTTAVMSTAKTDRSPVRVHWSREQAIINLRGDPADQGLMQALSAASGLPWPTRPAACPSAGGRRVVWAGPDDWFIIGPQGAQGELWTSLKSAAADRHHALTDVSSGYVVLTLAGPAAADLLSQGCPLDLHPRVFQTGQSAGTHFFKASVWMWKPDAESFQLLVRSSFAGYVEEMLRRCTLESGLQAI